MVQHGSAKIAKVRCATASTCRAFPRMVRASKTSSNSNGQAKNADTFRSLLKAVCLVARTMTTSCISFLDAGIGLQDSIHMSAMWRFDQIWRLLSPLN